MSHETITNEEMLRDIADTEAEIETMEREIKAFRLLGDQWSLMKAGDRVTGIQKRMEFIVKVRALLAERGGSGR
jgi:hypothetical protein